MRSEKNKLGGEIEALTERQEKLSSRMEKASSDFERDIKLIRQTRDELAKIAEMKGRYEKEVEDMEWAEQIIPSYTTLLKGLAQLPDEFELRFWASHIEAFLHKVKGRYENLRAKAQQADLWGKFMTLGIDVVLRAEGMEPIPPPERPRLGISVSSSGKIEPDWIDNPNREPKAIVVTYEEFMAIAQKLRDKLLKGTIVPLSEYEIPKLMYSEASV